MFCYVLLPQQIICEEFCARLGCHTALQGLILGPVDFCKVLYRLSYVLYRFIYIYIYPPDHLTASFVQRFPEHCTLSDHVSHSRLASSNCYEPLLMAK